MSSSDSSGSETTSTEAPTKAEFIKQGDAICQKTIDEGTKLTADLDENTPDEDIVKFIEDDYIPLIQDEISQLKELTPPEGDEETWDGILASLDEGISNVEDDPEAAAKGNENPLAEASKQSEAYGFKVCGQN